MKSKMRKKLIAFMLCMVLVICNSVSILADAPAAATTATEKQVKETGTAKSEGASEEEKSADDEKDTSEQSDEESAPETETTEKKEETTEATTEDKEDATTATTTKAKEETTEATETSDKDQTTGVEDDSDKKDETSETSEEETDKEKTTEAKDETAPSELTYTNDDVVITVSEVAEGAIPEGAELRVVPILKDDADTQTQYAEVEEKIQEKAAETETEIKGFLAYDITFVDEEGNEIEPNSEVKVSIEYKQAAIPAELSEEDAKNTEVSVMHLEEDADGNVSQVVDMGEAGKVDALETTDAKQVEKVEVKTESFSTFTIIWEESGYTITVHYVNEEYQEITSDNVQSDSIPVMGSNEIIIKNYRRAIDGYTYSNYASVETIGKPDEETPNVPSIYSVRVNNNGNLQYKENQNDSWNNWGNSLGYEVYLIYTTNEDFATIETVDNETEHITLRLFDYSLGSGENAENSWYSANPGEDNYYDSGINSDKELKFLSNADPDTNLENMNKWTKGIKTFPGIVQSGLREKSQTYNDENITVKYPVLNGYDSQSLDYLFDLSGNKYKKVYADANHLFTKDADGYFSFDSDTNYAQFDTVSQNFTVYSNQYRDTSQKIGSYTTQGLRVFYPFDSFSDVVSSFKSNGGTVFGVESGSRDWGFEANEANHYFGMTMSATFYQPQDGLINGNNMVFEFTGDDDVWVYIDDKLVLDLGGIHDRASGSIDFANGNVYINGNTVSNMYENIFDEEFEDYSTHTIDFFYLERGNNASNCKLKFNFPTIPDDSVMVTKQVTGDDGQTLDYAQDIDFQFNITKNGEALGNAEYDILENGHVIDHDTTDENGNFTLKHGQSATFENFKATDKYEVKETGASLNEGYEVTIDSVNVVLNNEEGTAEQTLQSASTGEQRVSDLSSAVFRNRIKNTATLSIQKLIDSEDQTALAGKTFNIRVWINGESYSGSYSVGTDSNTATNGIISLTGGQTATITGLPYGVAIEVEEVLDGSCRPTYAISENTYNVVLPSLDEDGNQLLDEDGNPVSDVTSACANISGNATVTVTNHKVNADSGTTKLTVQKTWEEGTDNIRPEAINVTLYQDNNNNGIKDEGDTVATGITATVPLNETNKWTHTWENLPADTNFVVEESEVEAGDLEEFESNLELTSSFDFSYLDRVTTCRKLTYLLGKNNMLLVKLTSNSGYLLWTPINLGLSEAEVQEISNSIKQMNLPGSGSLSDDLSDVNLKYVWGTTDSAYTNGITLSQTDTGWELDFGDTSNWAQFWNLQYDRTINAGINNTLDNTIDISVEKQWSGDMQMWENVQYITVQLYRNNEEFENPVNIYKNRDGEWTHTFDDLDKYYKDESGEYIPYEYRVEETLIYYSDNLQRYPSNPDGFTVEYSGNAKDGFLIENIWIHDWQIFKVSSTDSDFPLVLGGAEFILTKEGDSIPSYYGATYDYDKYLPEDSDTPVGYVEGKVYWWKEEANKGTIAQAEEYVEDGTYILKETKAPDGYLVNSVTWTIEIEDLAVVRITDSNGQTITKYTPGASTRAAIQVDSYLFEDTPIYELPSAGGPGIYWYTFGGTLLMAGTALIVYRQKRKREVLLRK